MLFSGGLPAPVSRVDQTGVPTVTDAAGLAAVVGDATDRGGGACDGCTDDVSLVDVVPAAAASRLTSWALGMLS